MFELYITCPGPGAHSTAILFWHYSTPRSIRYADPEIDKRRRALIRFQFFPFTAAVVAAAYCLIVFGISAAFQATELANAGAQVLELQAQSAIVKTSSKWGAFFWVMLAYVLALSKIGVGPAKRRFISLYLAIFTTLGVVPVGETSALKWLLAAYQDGPSR